MKKINILSIIVLIGSLCACSGFLDTSSKTESTTDNYYKTESQAYRALVGCYDGWQCTVSYGPTYCFQYLSEILSDECFGGTGYSDGRGTQVVDRFDIGESSSEVNLHNSLWTYYYEAIYRCNELLQHEDDIEWTSEDTKKTYMGEARALRGILYFDMARLFERVPLITVPTTDNVPQSEPAEIYAQIVEDLKYAANNIPTSAYPKSDAANTDGHITCYAAKALLARVYLFYKGYYGAEPGDLTESEVKAGLSDIINSGQYSLVPVFKNLWPAASDNWVQDASGSWTNESTYAGDGNEETLLAMKFNYTSDYNGNSGGNNAIQMFGIRGGTFKAPYGQGWGGATVPTKVYASMNITGDQRCNASIINLSAEGIADMEDYQSKLYDQREYTGYTVKKYTPRSGYLQETDGSWTLTHLYRDVMGGDFQISQPQNYVVMRYADVLLMAAELGLDAQTNFDAVRKRAYTEDDGTLSGYYSQKSVSQANIMEERRLEFAFEGIRYWDLMRQGVSTLANAIVASGETTLSGGGEDVVSYSADNITSKRGFQQIPQTQIQLSGGVLTQNAGW